jgi:YD repeat-containing protein
MLLPSIAPQVRGYGLATGLDHRFRYVARLSSNVAGMNGNSWVVTSLPYVHYSTATIAGMPAKVVLMGMGGAQWEWVSGTGYVGLFGTRRRLDVIGSNVRMLSSDGGMVTFYGPSIASPLRGRQQSAVSPQGVITTVTYDGNSRIASETRTDPVSGDQAMLLYTFAPSGVHQGRITRVEKRLVRSGVEHPIHRWLFTYHSGADSAGSLNDLKTAEEQILEAATGSWASLGTRYFRYYKSNSGIGFTHGLRYVVEADGYARMKELGIDPENVSQTTDAVLAGYAAESYEYDADRRHSKVVLRAGTETTTFARLNSDGASVRNWARREIATRPDGSTLTTYFDTAERRVLEILKNGSDDWPEYWEFNADNRETLHATSSAIASVTEPANASQNFTVTLKAGAGLIETKDYYPASGGGAGSAPLHLKLTSVKEGASGTPVKQQELTYLARTVGGDTIYMTANATVFRDSNGGGTSPATTENLYSWRGSTFAVLSHTVTPPVVGTGENGTGVKTSRVTFYDDYGNARWRKNERGRIDYAVYDRITGALHFRIEDANTADLQDVPAGWSTPVGFGSSRRTDSQSDRLGRSTLVLGPAHLVPTKNEAGAVVAVLTRRADFACYLDGKREVRSAKGGSTLGGFYTLGTVTLRRLNFANRELEVIEAARACECGPLSPTEVFPQSAWKRWRREFHNAAEYRDESRVWHAIPVTGEGFENVNYYATRYGRDAMGRENRVTSPGGTIHRSVIDARGNPSSKWIGTNDTGATNTDPTGGGATGNNLVKVATHVYDNGADGGNGNLTSVIRPVDGNSANDRTETFTYDFRDRLTGGSRSDGTNTYLDRFTLDNRGNTTQTDAYHTSVAAANLTARSKTFFDARGRDYKDETFSIDPTTGAVGNALVARRWRDASGNVMKETFQGIEGFVKRTFDAFDQILRSYSACNPTGGSNDNHPANDTVVEQTETLYDAAGDTVQATAWQRFHDATGNGPLNGPTGPDPKARRTYACFWQDAIGRGIASADYGTNGGAILLRPEVPPPTSEEVLVTVTRYATTGEPGEVIAADGTVTRTKRNALGQEIQTIENFKDGAAPAADVNRTTRFAYHPSGGLETLTLVNDVTGDQVTRWVYGTTLTDSGVATGHLLRAKIYPESDDANAPLGNGPDGIYERTEHTYNRQGEVVTTKDPNETVHTYERNQLGQLIHDRITAFGPGVNQTIKRVTITFDAKRPALTAKVTCFDHATPGSGSVVNEVGFTYDGLGQQTKDRQAHGGVVIPGSTPEVGYSYETP